MAVAKAEDHTSVIEFLEGKVGYIHNMYDTHIRLNTRHVLTLYPDPSPNCHVNRHSVHGCITMYCGCIQELVSDTTREWCRILSTPKKFEGSALPIDSDSYYLKRPSDMLLLDFFVAYPVGCVASCHNCMLHFFYFSACIWDFGRQVWRCTSYRRGTYPC